MSFISRVLDFVSGYLRKGSERSLIVKRNILQSSIFKVLSIVLSLLIVPLTINYISAEQYGIWLTVSSIVAWISYFDLGLGHGLRNRFAECKAQGNTHLAKQYISTSFAIFSIIFVALFIIFFIANHFLNWQAFLKISQLENSELQSLMLILVGFFCLTMIFKVTNSLLLGDQRTAFASGIAVADQFLALVIIYILTKTVEPRILYLAFSSYGVPFVVLLIITVLLFSKRGIFYQYRPSLSCIDFHLTKRLLGLGVKFFVIQVSLLVIFQFVNIILSRNCGQLAVAQYNLSYKYFNMLHMAEVIILTPFWTAFTDAYTKRDYPWMKSICKKLNRLAVLSIPVVVVMVLIAPLFFKLWLNDSVEVPYYLNICMAIYMVSMIYASLQMYLLNGLGKVNIQLIIYVLFSVISIPLMNILSKSFSMYGILLVLTLVYSVQAVVGGIQIRKILNNRAVGYWNK